MRHPPYTVRTERVAARRNGMRDRICDTDRTQRLPTLGVGEARQSDELPQHLPLFIRLHQFPIRGFYLTASEGVLQIGLEGLEELRIGVVRRQAGDEGQPLLQFVQHLCFLLQKRLEALHLLAGRLVLLENPTELVSKNGKGICRSVASHSLQSSRDLGQHGTHAHIHIQFPRDTARASIRRSVMSVAPKERLGNANGARCALRMLQKAEDLVVLLRNQFPNLLAANLVQRLQSALGGCAEFVGMTTEDVVHSLRVAARGRRRAKITQV